MSMFFRCASSHICAFHLVLFLISSTHPKIWPRFFCVPIHSLMEAPEANFVVDEFQSPEESKLIFLDWLTEIQVVVGFLLLVFTPLLCM